MGRPSKFSEYLQKLRNYVFSYGIIPSYETLTSILGVSSKRTIHRFFQQCIEGGYLQKYDNQFTPTEKLSGLPLFGSVPAGSPDDASDEKKGDVNINQLLIENPSNTVLLTAHGDSMIDAGIMAGDMMVVNISQQAREGDIVIGVVDNDYTVKYLYKDKTKKRFLKPANQKKSYQAIYADKELSIYGVVTGVLRKY